MLCYALHPICNNVPCMLRFLPPARHHISSTALRYCFPYFVRGREEQRHTALEGDGMERSAFGVLGKVGLRDWQGLVLPYHHLLLNLILVTACSLFHLFFLCYFIVPAFFFFPQCNVFFYPSYVTVVVYNKTSLNPS